MTCRSVVLVHHTVAKAYSCTNARHKKKVHKMKKYKRNKFPTDVQIMLKTCFKNDTAACNFI